MKIVDVPSSTLGREGGAWLYQMVQSCLLKDQNYFSFMENLRNLLKGEHWKNIKGISKNQIKMVVNLAHAHIRTLVPTLFFQNPSVDALPTSPIHAGKETTWNGILNNTIDRINFAEEFKKFVLDACLYPEGVMKDITKKPERETSEVKNEGPAIWMDQGSPVHLRISPSQLLVDFRAKDRDLEKARFIAIRYKKTYQEIKNHPIYGKNFKIERNSSSGGTLSTGNLVSNRGFDDPEFDNLHRQPNTYGNEDEYTIYEVWINQLISNDGKFKLYRQMCVLVDGQDEPLRELEIWDAVMGEGFNEYPVTRLVLNPIPDDLPQSELGVWQGMQMAMNWLISRVTELVENDKTIVTMDVGKVKNAAKAKEQIMNGRSREVVEVTGPDAFNLIQPSFVGRDNYTLVNMLQSYIQQVSGVGQNRRGGSGIRTATEASLIDKGTEIKTDEKVSVVEKAILRIIRKMAMIIRSLVKSDLGTSWVFRIGGDVGAIKWLNFTAEDIQWMPEIRLRVNSFRKQDSMQDLQKFGGLLQSALQLYSIYGPTIRVDILFQRLLESAGIYDATRIVGDMDKQSLLQTIELSGLMSGVPTPVTEEQNHPAHLQVIEQFRQSEFGQQLMAAAPELADRLAQHEQEHMMQMQIMQEKAQRMQAAANPFAVAGTGGSPSPQSVANGETSGDRSAIQAIPGGNGEFS